MADVNNPNGAQVTGTEDEFQAFLRQEIANQFQQFQQQQTQAQPAQNQPVPAAAPVTPAAQPISVTLNGQNFQFANQEELNRALNNTFSAYNAELEKARGSQSRSGAEVTGAEDDTPKFSLEHFVEKMTTNPVEAFEYVDEFRFGVKNPSQVLKSYIEESQRQKTVMAAYQFKDAHPEFPSSPQAGQAMEQLMRQYNLPYDVNGLEAAYAIGLTRGLFQPAQAAQPQVPAAQVPAVPAMPQNPYAAPQFQPGYNPANPYLQAPPRVPARSGADLPPDILAMAEELPLDQLEATIRRLSGGA